MREIKKILLISSRNLYNTSGELRLVKNRTQTLLQNYCVSTDCVMIKYKKVLNKPQEQLPCNSFRLFTHNMLDYKLREREMMHYVADLINEQTEVYSAIVLSGMQVIPLAPALKVLSPKSKIIADLHGAFEELVEFPGSSFTKAILRRIYYKIAKKNERKYLKTCDGFYVVSRALQKYIETEYHIEGKPFFIIPCGIPQTEVDVDFSIENRAKYRAKYNIKDDDTLFIYSGGVSPWQCIEESVRMFERLKQKTDKKIILLLLSGNKNAIAKYRSNDIIIDSYSGEEVRKVLCAGDYAFMLRQEFVTNNVAYPNKFLEYVSAGLRVITTTAVRDIADQILQYKVGQIVELTGDLDWKLIENRKPYLDDVEQRNALLKATSFETTLASFVDYIEKR